MKKKLQVFEAPEITVSFDPGVCRHSGVCLRTLPTVFDVRRARWIQPGVEPAEHVAAAVQKCPSGALQFYRNVSRNPAAAAQLARRVLLNHLGLCVAGPGTRAEQAAAISSAIATARGYDFVGIYDVLEGEIAVVGWSGKQPPQHPRFPRERGLCGAAVESVETQVVNDVSRDPRYLTTTSSIRSEMIVPVVDPATRVVVGTLDMASSRLDGFGTEDQELMEDCGRAIVDFWTENE